MRNSFSRDCVAVDGLADVLWTVNTVTDVVIEMSSASIIGTGVDTTIDLDFAVGVECDIDAMTDVWAVSIVGVVMWSDITVDDFTAVMTAVDFVLPTP